MPNSLMAPSESPARRWREAGIRHDEEAGAPLGIRLETLLVRVYLNGVGYAAFLSTPDLPE